MRNNRILMLKMFLIMAFLFGACNLPDQLQKQVEPEEQQPSATPRPSATATEILEIPSDTPLPPPTDTLLPEPTSTSTILYTVAVTFSPTPTDAPGVTVRIRNMSGMQVNLYRYEPNGKLKFLGWLVHGYYGIFQFPSLGEWKIRWCQRDKEGNSLNCQNKLIMVKEEDQEFRVP